MITAETPTVTQLFLVYLNGSGPMRGLDSVTRKGNVGPLSPSPRDSPGFPCFPAWRSQERPGPTLWGIVLPLAGRSPEGRLVHLILQYFLSTKVDQLHENHWKYISASGPVFPSNSPAKHGGTEEAVSEVFLPPDVLSVLEQEQREVVVPVGQRNNPDIDWFVGCHTIYYTTPHQDIMDLVFSPPGTWKLLKIFYENHWKYFKDLL